MMRIGIWALAAALAAALAMAGGCKKSSSSSAAAADERLLHGAAAIASGRVAVGKDGVADLPQTMQSYSSNQKAYVKKEADGTTWVLLPQSIDGSNVKGLLYCNHPPDARPTTVKVLGPKASGSGAAPMQVTVDGEPQPGLYSVHSGG
ncbi:MAG TPA: hypothetical protein VH475_02670 [Tepidisphaeraceae bacterium]|jgi:hypothetical protein